MVDIKTIDKIKQYIDNNLFEEAESLISEVYDKNSSDKLAPLLALAKSYIGKYDEAFKIFELIINDEKNQIPEIYDRLITCCNCLKLRDKAYSYAEIFYKKFPQDEKAMSQYVYTMMYIGKVKEAEDLCAELLAKFPNSESLLIRMGILIELNHCNDELAKECYERVIELNPENLNGYNNLAIVLSKLGKYREAEDLYKRILEVYPDSKDVKKSLGLLYLKQRNFNNGYKNFVQRPLKGSEHNIKTFWQGENVEELSVICDQGFGDHIQFVRYLPFLKEKAKKINVYCYRGLTKLFEQNYKDFGNFYFYDDNAVFPDVPSVLITNLSYFLDLNFNNIPFKNGYLKCNEEKYNYYKNKYFNNQKLKIGICWEAGATEVRELIHKSISINFLEPILSLSKEKYEFYSFQARPLNDEYKKYEITDLGTGFESFDDTASAMKNLDLLITVDTANAHLAGALGINTIMLLPYCPDWRWFDNTEKTEWYDSLKIVKQSDCKTWNPEIQKIKDFVQSL